jgi:Protein of unknown function (DUF4031)
VTVYVDDWRQWAQVGPVEGRWSHLTADSDAELHEFASRLGLRREWFQDRHRDATRHHYDVTEPTRVRAIAAGARAVTWREAARIRRQRREAEAASAAGREPSATPSPADPS